MKSIVILLFATSVISHRAYSQLDSTFETVFRLILEDDRFSADVFQRQYGCAFAISNELFVNQINNYDSFPKLYKIDSTFSCILFQTKYGPLKLNGSPLMLETMSEDGIRKIIVIDRYKNSGPHARLTFHTTSLASNFKMKHFEGDTDFKKYDCKLVFSNSNWSIVTIKITPTTFKSIVD